MKPLLFLLLIILLSSCATSYCPNERAGKEGPRKDKNLNRKVATAW